MSEQYQLAVSSRLTWVLFLVYIHVLITEEIVYKKLSSLKINNVYGDDDIASVVHKEISNEIKQAITIIYIRSTTESKVPDDWKTAN